MYEKNADIMDSLSNAKNSVVDGAMSLLQKIRGSSANDGVAALPESARKTVNDGVAALPESARKTVESLRDQPMQSLAEKATKALGEGGRKLALGEGGRKLKDSAASGLAYVPGIGGSLDGFFNPIPGRGRFVSSMGEGQMASRFGASSGLLGGVGGATVGTAGSLLALLLSKGRLNPSASLALGLGGPLGGAAAGGLVGNSIGTHAGANLFREMAAKEGAFTPPLIGNQEELDVNDNDKIDAADLAALRKRKKPVKSAELIGDQEELDVNDNDKIDAADLATLRRGKKLSKDKTKFAEWTPAPSFSANMPLPEKKPNPFVSGKKPSAKADASGAEAALAKLGSQDNCSPSRSAAGDSKGVKYKQQTEDHATGTAAFDSLDKYLRMAKKAGLNDFQTNFFGRLIQEGRNEQELYTAVKHAGDQFGFKVGKELNRGLEKLSNWGALGKGLMTGAKYLGAGALGAGAGVAASGAVQKGVQQGVQQGVKDGVQQGVQNVGNNAVNSASNFMGNMANTASNFMGNYQQNGDNIHRVRSNIPEPAGNQYQAVRSNIPETGGNLLQNMANASTQHFGNMANSVIGMLGGAAANRTGQQNSGFNPLQNMPGVGGAFGGANKVNGLGGGFTGNGINKQSREKQAWFGKLLAPAAKYLGMAVAKPGAYAKGVYDTARSAVSHLGPLPPIPTTMGQGIKAVLKDPTMRSQIVTGAGTGFTNPFTGAFAGSNEGDGWGDYAARVGGSTLAGIGAGMLGGRGTQDLMRRAFAGNMIGGSGDMLAAIGGYDTGGMGGKAGFLSGGISPAKLPGFLNAAKTPGVRGSTTKALELLDPFNNVQRLVGAGYTKHIAPNIRPIFDKAMSGIKNNRGIAVGGGLGVAGIGTGAYIGNKAVSGITDASERINAQMNMLRNETNNNLSGIREGMGGGMGQFFEENKHWLMPALLAGGGALAGGALGGQSGAAMGGLSLPALYMMHQNGMFGGGAANPLQAPPSNKRPDYAQQNQQYEREQVDKQVADRSRDPRLANPTKPKTAGDRAVRLMRQLSKN